MSLEIQKFNISFLHKDCHVKLFGTKCGEGERNGKQKRVNGKEKGEG